MLTGMMVFLAGIVALQQCTVLPAAGWSWGLLSLALLPVVARPYRYLLLFVCGFLWALWRAHLVLDIALPSHLQGKDLLATGVIATIPLQHKHKQRFEFDIETLHYRNQRIDFPARVRLSWYQRAGKGGKKQHQATLVKAGQRWQFWLRLKQPHGFMNPGGFDYEGWLFQKGIRATGYVRIKAKKQQFARLLAQQAEGYRFVAMRQHLHDNLQHITAAYPFAGILLALAMGERSAITQAQWQVFRATGTSHLIAISGLHIGLLAGFVFFLARYLWSRSFRLTQWLAAPRAAAVIALLVATFYALLSGFAIPAQRAVTMLAIVMLSIFFQRKMAMQDLLAVALLAVLLLDPLAVLSAGFWLSFAAVALIAYAAAGRLRHESTWWQWSRLQWRISLALIPLLLFLFQHAALNAPLANMVAIPIVSFLLVPLILVAATLAGLSSTVATLLFALSDKLLAGLWIFLQWLAAWPQSQWLGSSPSVPVLILAMVGMLLLLAPRGWPLKWLGVILLLPLLFPRFSSVQAGHAELTLLDVGQGLAAVVRTRKHVLLFDTGPRFSARFDTGAAVILPFLRQNGISRLDTVMLSHADLDHRGGMASVAQYMPIHAVFSSFERPGSRYCQRGIQWQWDGVVFRVLNPPAEYGHKKRNNRACVLQIEAGGQRILLTADIERNAEQELLDAYAGQLRSDVLVVAHHGSKTSTSAAFLDVVRPQVALIPVGFRNRYRMPHATVLQRLKQRDIAVWATGQSGALRLQIGQKNSNLRVETYRSRQQKYWNSRHEML